MGRLLLLVPVPSRALLEMIGDHLPEVANDHGFSFLHAGRKVPVSGGLRGKRTEGKGKVERKGKEEGTNGFLFGLHLEDTCELERHWREEEEIDQPMW
jgi:hypothetical protein